jgi:hypothetical protein
MQIRENSRRNFISNIAFISAGIMIKPAFNSLPSITGEADIRNKWKSFWKKSGGQKTFDVVDLRKNNNLIITKGHIHKNGGIIYFPKENILAQPTWIYWTNSESKPADVVITLFEKNSLKKIGRMNRFEADALYKVSKDYDGDNLLGAFCNNLTLTKGDTEDLLKNKISVKKDSHLHEMSYYKNHSLVLNKKFIYHS